MALEEAILFQNKDDIKIARDMVKMSVLAVVILAPLGATVMMLTGPKLLNKVSEEEHQRRRELSRLRILRLQSVF